MMDLRPAISAAIPRTALVTGGGKRIGRAIALALAELGFSVAIHCRHSRLDAESVAEAASGFGVGSCVLEADLAREESVHTLLPAAQRALGPIGVLVNNASVFERDAWQDADRTSWDRHIEPNLRAPVALTQAFAQGLPEAAEGVVINLLDQRVWSLTPHFLSYTASKAALWAMTQSAALALAPRIRVNAIGPGPALASPRQTPAQFARQCGSVPLQHGTTPTEIGHAAAVILALPSLTGQMLALDGGQHLQWGGGTASDE